MIHVIATIELQPDTREHYLKILKENVPNVKAEAYSYWLSPANKDIAYLKKFWKSNA